MTRLATILACLWASQAGAAQCFDTLTAYETLADNHGESRRASGFSKEGVLVEMWGNDSTGTWTALVTRPDGVSCIVGSGEHFMVDDPAPEGERG